MNTHSSLLTQLETHHEFLKRWTRSKLSRDIEKAIHEGFLYVVPRECALQYHRGSGPVSADANHPLQLYGGGAVVAAYKVLLYDRDRESEREEEVNVRIPSKWFNYVEEADRFDRQVLTIRYTQAEFGAWKQEQRLALHAEAVRAWVSQVDVATGEIARLKKMPKAATRSAYS